jgi:hypothetical protein
MRSRIVTTGFILFLKLPNSGITVRVPDMWNRMATRTIRCSMRHRLSPGAAQSVKRLAVATFR